MANHDLSSNMLENINQIGNALTKAGWPEYEIIEGQPRLPETYYNALMENYTSVMKLETDFHDCVNELCMKCGNYKEQHNGACGGCRWLIPRRGW